MSDPRSLANEVIYVQSHCMELSEQSRNTFRMFDMIFNVSPPDEFKPHLLLKINQAEEYLRNNFPDTLEWEEVNNCIKWYIDNISSAIASLDRFDQYISEWGDLNDDNIDSHIRDLRDAIKDHFAQRYISTREFQVVNQALEDTWPLLIAKLVEEIEQAE